MSVPVRPAGSTHDAPFSGEAPPGDGEVVVRPDRRRQLRNTAVVLCLVSALVFWLPALIVLVRREPAYFTAGIAWTALAATVATIGLGLAATALWQRTGRRRLPVLTVHQNGVRIPARPGTPALDARWEDLALVKLIGSRDPEMAFYLRPREEEPGPELVALDLSEPEFLRPLDFDNDPPPVMGTPDRRVFDEIAPLPEEDQPSAAAQPRPTAAEQLHATPYVVRLGRTRPDRPGVLLAVRRLAAGRVPLA